MKKVLLFYSLFCTMLPFAIQAQVFLGYKTISFPDTYLRDSVHVFATIDALIPTPGQVVVHFTGSCYPDLGDLIIVAANNYPDWQTNDGNIGIYSTNVNIGKSFSHTRVYTYDETDLGVHSFYAVGHNYAGTNGSGIASVYGTLTVEFFPDVESSAIAAGGIIFNENVTDAKVVSQQTIHASSAGKVIVRFDGSCESSPGDRIVLAASNTTNWSSNDGNVTVESDGGDEELSPFSHTREYVVPAAGDYTYYAVAQNVGETDGDGTIYLYGNLIVEFYPSSGSTLLAFQGFSQPGVILNDPFFELTSVTINCPDPGVVMVDFDGDLTSQVEDDVELGASDGLSLTADDGEVIVQALNDDLNRNCFAHSRVYTVDAGQHTFYGLGRVDPLDPGTGLVNIFGELLVKYFPYVNTAVADVKQTENDFTVFPMPSSDRITLSFNPDTVSNGTIKLLDGTGRIINQYQRAGTKDLTIDITSLPQGLYWVASGTNVKPVVKL